MTPDKHLESVTQFATVIAAGSAMALFLAFVYDNSVPQFETQMLKLSLLFVTICTTPLAVFMHEKCYREGLNPWRNYEE